jgi:hypothetical protein
MECMECGEEVDRLYEDPRTPPLDTDPCLCVGCCEGEIDCLIDALEDEKEWLQSEKAKLKEARADGC